MNDGMPILGPAPLFTLFNRETLRLQLPELPIAGIAKPLQIHLNFDAAGVDEMIERQTVLRAQMLPAPALNQVSARC